LTEQLNPQPYGLDDGRDTTRRLVRLAPDLCGLLAPIIKNNHVVPAAHWRTKEVPAATSRMRAISRPVIRQVARWRWMHRSFGHHHCQRRKYQPHRSFEDASIKV